MTFFNALAWIFGTLAVLLLILRIFGWFLYDERARLLDKIRGVEQTFPIIWPGAICIVCGAWLLWGGK